MQIGELRRFLLLFWNINCHLNTYYEDTFKGKTFIYIEMHPWCYDYEYGVVLFSI